MRILAIGDSVPAGAATAGDPFPERAGQVLSRELGVPVEVVNSAVSGSLTALAQVQLRFGSRTRRAARQADVVVVTAGANELVPLFWLASCGMRPDGARFVPVAVSQVEALVRRLRRTNPTALLYVCTYWNLFRDGRRELDDDRRRWSREVTGRFNATLADRCAGLVTAVLDVRAAFEAACGTDPTPLLAADGEHPNTQGHEVITHLLAGHILRDRPV